MRTIFFLFAVVSLVFAQTAQNPMQSDFRDCYDAPPYITHDTIAYVKGMQLQTQFTDTTNISNEPSIIHTVDISGIVDSVIDTATIELIIHNGETNHSSGYFFLGNDKPMSYTHRITLHNFKATYLKENPMTKVLDSSWIFIPYNFQIKPSDSIFIKGYSAIYRYIWSANECQYNRSKDLAGEFFIFPNNTSAIKSSITRKETVIKKRNRDASGKMLKKNTARKIIY